MIESMLKAAGVRSPSYWASHVAHAFDIFGITSDKAKAAWIAQCAHESAGFSVLEENLNYRATTLATVWPKRFAVMQNGKPMKDKAAKNVPNKFALAIERKPELIANVVYSNRMGNGPVESGEGWKFRGRGLKQLTGKSNYTRCATALGVDLVSNPDMLLDPKYAALSAAWFWNENACGNLAEVDDFIGLTRRINGGIIGLEDRRKRYDAIIASLKL